MFISFSRVNIQDFCKCRLLQDCCIGERVKKGLQLVCVRVLPERNFIQSLLVNQRSHAVLVLSLMVSFPSNMTITRMLGCRQVSFMEDWLKSFDRWTGCEKRKVLWFLDNAPSHPKQTLQNVKLQILPANTTSVCQPMDQGIIQAMKRKYR